MDTLAHYYGRLFTENQLDTNLKKLAQSKASFDKRGKDFFCGRCQSKAVLEHILPNGNIYCRKCIVFGRVESQAQLYYFPAQPFPKGEFLRWQGELTPFQGEISKALLRNYEHGLKTLVYAVTGAGKTEMIYALLAKVLNQGGWVALASPRIDVCIEIHKRLVRDFSCTVQLMHAGSGPYKRSPLIVLTTHQLLKFYQAFDLIIIDEVDSFPFVDNAVLNHAVQSALKEEGRLVYLTATSTRALEKEVASGQLSKLTLSRRFHNNPLVVPKFRLVFQIQQALEKGKLPRALYQAVKKQLQSPYPLLIFYPVIEKGQEFFQILQKSFDEIAMAYVSSQTEERKEKIEAFREGKLRILISTTILERGVTFPGVDVLFVLADHHLFNSSSLIQIAGRVGRSLDRPDGQLVFFHEGVSAAMYKARKEIIGLNKEAYG
ncbi:competence protein [Streptococcus penaeicida]|uniref:Competence protein n=1 Tax=Streptococcus penaeicida TaxID=1765960 RepID=A0A2N8LE93_9STRE|nr:DEAD/DEAH box helicase [Streptococcus penaeicida]PND48499.1 competence protein [Streptococcus penaeicida]